MQDAVLADIYYLFGFNVTSIKIIIIIINFELKFVFLLINESISIFNMFHVARARGC